MRVPLNSGTGVLDDTVKLWHKPFPAGVYPARTYDPAGNPPERVTV